MSSRWRRLRRSNIEKNGSTSGGAPSLGVLARKLLSWSRARSDSVVGMIGTSRASAALKTFSDRREMLGGQSRKTCSYRLASGRTTRARLRPGSLAASSTTSRFRNEKSDGIRSRPSKSVGVMASRTSTFPRTSDFPRCRTFGAARK